MILIEHQELASAQASITFSDIPQDYTDLYLTVSSRDTTDTGSAVVYVNFNGSTTGYSSRLLRGTGSATSSVAITTSVALQGRTTPSDATASTFGSSTFYIPNYTSSSAKSVSIDSVQEENATEAWQSLTAGLWSGTDAITSIVVKVGAGNLAQYSSATLYGITAGSDGITSVS